MANTNIAPNFCIMQAKGPMPQAICTTTTVVSGHAGVLSATTTSEQFITTGSCKLFAIYPQSTTTVGTITIRNGTKIILVIPIGLTVSGKIFAGNGILADLGLSIQLSSSADIVLVDWMPYTTNDSD